MTRPSHFLLLLLLVLAAVQVVPATDGGSVIRLVEIHGVVTPVTRVVVERAIEDASAQVDDLILIEMDTPGGMVSSMEEMVQAILASEVPVVVWVGPAGAKAASAGFYILIASDIAAMAPGTRTGAASVVYGMGGENTEDDIMLRKANKDAGAMIRSIAERRGRNVEACEKAVAESDAYTDQYALDNGLIDLLAASRGELMELLDGREVTRFDGSVERLSTAEPRFVTTELSVKDEFMDFLASPAIAYFLLLLGLGGLYIEFTHPGMVLPGVVGAFCLLLFALSAAVLPINATGILLILLAVVMFVLEVKVVSYGMLTIGGIASLVIGSFLLVDGPIPELRVPFSMIIPMSLAMAAVVILAVYLARKAQMEKVDTGVEGLVGEIGTVSEELAPQGKILVHGEIWAAAVSDGTAAAGSRVRVVRVENMSLQVEVLDSGRITPAGSEV